MPKRRSLLLAVLIGLLGVLAYDNWFQINRWCERQREGDSGKWRLPDLGIDFEARKRAWEGGPQAVEDVLEHGSPRQRYGLIAFLMFPERGEADARIVGQWRDELLRLMQHDPEPTVRVAACRSLAVLIREELVAEVPQRLLKDLRRMLRGNDNERSSACIAAMHLGERAEPLRQDLLAMDVTTQERSADLQMWACLALEALGAVDADTTRYLLRVITVPDGEARDSAASALRGLRVMDAEVVAVLSPLLIDREQPIELRVAALEALAAMPLSSEAAVALMPVATRALPWFDSIERERWVSALVALVLRTNDADSRAAASEALTRASDDTGLKYKGVAEAGLLRLAIADRDVDAVRRVLPKVLEAIVSKDADLDDAMFWTSPDDIEGLFEALVELWEWQRDEFLRDRVSMVLTEVEATQPSWIRKWARPLLARLRN